MYLEIYTLYKSLFSNVTISTKKFSVSQSIRFRSVNEKKKNNDIYFDKIKLSHIIKCEMYINRLILKTMFTLLILSYQLNLKHFFCYKSTYVGESCDPCLDVLTSIWNLHCRSLYKIIISTELELCLRCVKFEKGFTINLPL